MLPPRGIAWVGIEDHIVEHLMYLALINLNRPQIVREGGDTADIGAAQGKVSGLCDEVHDGGRLPHRVRRLWQR